VCVGSPFSEVEISNAWRLVFSFVEMVLLFPRVSRGIFWGVRYVSGRVLGFGEKGFSFVHFDWLNLVFGYFTTSQGKDMNRGHFGCIGWYSFICSSHVPDVVRTCFGCG